MVLLISGNNIYNKRIPVYIPNGMDVVEYKEVEEASDWYAHQWNEYMRFSKPDFPL